MSDRLFRAATSFLERRVSRRSVLIRMATGASALAVAPIRFLIRPVSAMSLISCSNCSGSSRCCDGYTVFCCTLTGQNACPVNTYMAGWWKCTSYRGNGPCGGEGVRYYMDCNRLPGRNCQGGCHCAFNNCSYRQTCCNVFKYGQCHTEIPGVTAIACRVIKCVNPCGLYSYCNCTYKQDNSTCSHEEDAICL
jgi:hypothetical protein